MNKTAKTTTAQTSAPRDLLAAAGLQITAALAGYLGTAATVLGGFHPFGLSVIAGCAPSYFLAAAFGSLARCVTFSAGTLFRHISAIFAIIAIRYILGQYGKKADTALCAAIVCGAVSVLTGGVAASVSFAQSLPVLAEGVLSGAGAYFVFKSRDLLPLRLKRPSETETAGAVILINILLMGLYSLSVHGLSPGHMAAVTVILAAARYGRIPAGAVAGTAASVSLMLTGGPTAQAVALAAGGVLAGLFAPLSRWASAMSLLLVSAVLSLSGGSAAEFVPATVETLTGCVVFLLLPKPVCASMSQLLAPASGKITLEGMKDSLMLKLRCAADGIKDVSKTAGEVSAKLSEINTPSIAKVFSAVAREACDGCPSRRFCWDAGRGRTEEILAAACGDIRAGEFSAETLGDGTELGCTRPQSVADSLKKHYSVYRNEIAAEDRLRELRDTVSYQFESTANMLAELSEEFGAIIEYDSETASKVADALAELGVTVDRCCCSVDKRGRMQFEIGVPMVSENVSRGDIIACAQEVCGREFASPAVQRSADALLISFTEKPRLTAETGMCQKCRGGEKLCGDSGNCFEDGHGRMYMVLSDGMGSGGRAAVDGAMLSGIMSRLIEAGFSVDCALKLTNSAMLFRSSDESLATADITAIDLYSGKIDLYKAGAAPTVVRRRGRTGRAESRSLPAGILRDVSFEHASLELSDGDIILMMSDGASCDGTDWICAEVEAWDGGSAAALAERIASRAKNEHSGRHGDDITVMAAILHSA